MSSFSRSPAARLFFDLTACLFGSQPLSFLLGTATRFFFDAATSLFFHLASRFDFGPHLRFDLYPQTSFLFSATTGFLLDFTTRFFLDATTCGFFSEASSFVGSLHSRLFPGAHALDLIFHRAESCFGATA